MGLLGDIFSTIDSAKRVGGAAVSGLLSDPGEQLRQWIANNNNEAGANQGLLAALYKDAQGKPTFDPTKWSPTATAAEQKLSGDLTGAMMGATVWHGSPHVFNKFDSSKIGTGEGAQAYGHGLYLAESPDVAKSYQTALTADRGFNFGGKQGLTRQQIQDAVNAREGGGYLDGVTRPSGVADVVLDNAIYGGKSGLPRQYKPGSERAALYERLQGEIQHTDKGALYKVDLPDQHIAKMLDWDKPLSQQPEALAGIRALAARPEMPPGFAGAVEEALKRKFDGQDLYMETMKVHKDAATAAQAMRDAGIPGIRYLDQQSRGAGGTSNYVVFPGNESLLQIQERNGQPLIGPGR